MKALALLAGFVASFAACPPIPPPAPIFSTPSCGPVDALPVTSGVCPYKFGPDDLACVRCPAAKACVDTSSMVYCVSSAGCKDPLCVFVPPPS